MSRVTGFEVKSFLFGMLFCGLDAAPLASRLTIFDTQASCRDASRMALLRRRTPQTVRQKTNNSDSAHWEVATLSASMNHHPGNTAGSPLTTWLTLSL